jgi:ATP-dependent Clp protease ATP-binding subunit ClpA
VAKIERFTQRARRVLSLSQETAERFQHNYIGTEHLLLGLIYEGGGVGARVLHTLGLDRRRVEELVERMTRAGQRGANARLDLSSDYKNTLEMAVDEARRLGHNYIGTEHLLLGLMRQGQGVAMDVLTRLNVSPEEVRRQVNRALELELQQPEFAQRASLYGALIAAIVNAARTQTLPDGQTLPPFTESNLLLGDWIPILDRAIGAVRTSQRRVVMTEDLLLALMSDSTAQAAYLLRALGLRWEEARITIHNRSVETQNNIKELAENEVVEAVWGISQTGFSTYAIRALSLAVSQAYGQSNGHLNGEYMLLGLVLEEESSAIDLLKESGIAPEAVKKAVLNVLKP